MKKYMFLLPMIAMTNVALAQSSVTVFGVVDATIAIGKGSVLSQNSMSRGGLSTPRLGFRGEEDLGNGLKAGFWLEGQVNTDDGTGGSLNTNNQKSGASVGAQSLNFARRATISVSNDLGEIRLGRDYLPQYNNVLRGDIFGNVGVGAALNFTAISAGYTAVRASNMISYLSPKVSGFTTHIATYFGENTDGPATSYDGSGTGIHLGYENGPIQVGVATGTTHYATGNTRQSNIQAAYDFGVVKITSQYNQDRTAGLNAHGGAVGGSMPIGPGIIKAGYSWYNKNNKSEASKLSLGYVYSLSKRTQLYATAARIDNSGGAKYSLNSSVTDSNKSSTGYDFGIKHSF